MENLRQDGIQTLHIANTTSKPHEAEYLGIICALEEVLGDVEVLSDNQSAVDVLNGVRVVRRKIKPYIDRIRKLSENRFVKISLGNRDFNEASLRQEGFHFSKYAMRNSKR